MTGILEAQTQRALQDCALPRQETALEQVKQKPPKCAPFSMLADLVRARLPEVPLPTIDHVLGQDAWAHYE